MKYIWKDVYMAGVMGILVPGLLLNVGVMASEEAAQNQIVTEAVVLESEPVTEPVSKTSVPIRFLSNGNVQELELEEYLVGKLGRHYTFLKPENANLLGTAAAALLNR